MSARKEQKFKRLKKKRVIPAILIRLLLLVLSGVLLVGIYKVSLFYILGTQFLDDYDESVQVAEKVARPNYDSRSFPVVCYDAVQETGAIGACIINESGNAYGYNMKEFDPDSCVEISVISDISFYDILIYPERRSGETQIFNKKGELKLPFSTLMVKLAESIMGASDGEINIEIGVDSDEHTIGAGNPFVISGRDESSEVMSWMNNTLVSLDYWYKTEEQKDGSPIFIRNNVRLTGRDVLFVVAVCGTAGGMLLLLIIILFVNFFSDLFARQRLGRLLSLDAVTGGKNRKFFEYQARQILSRKSAGKLNYAIVDLEVQKYRTFCTCRGVKEGENLLENIDAYLNKFCRMGELTARYEEADFALLLKFATKEECVDRLSKIMNELSAKCCSQRITFKAGVTCLFAGRKQGKTRRSRKQEADVAQFRNEAALARAEIGPVNDNAMRFFVADMLQEQLWEAHVEERMEEALMNEEFLVYLQPKYDPQTEVLKGAEALIRWNSPVDGLISPGRFIPIFEKNGFITKIDDYMLSKVAALQSQWLSEGREAVTVSVNVSRAHFAMTDLAKHIADIIDCYSLPHHYIEIELTESAFFDDKQMLLSTVNELKQYGFEVSMDDFGSGYSSLNSLKDLPLDVLKLDAEFFRGDNANDPRSRVVVYEAIKLAKSLNMRVVAEGIEQKEQVDVLAQMGCDMIQGYYFSKPLPAGEYAGRMKQVNCS